MAQFLLVQVQKKFDDFITSNKKLLHLWEQLSIFDPRNLAGKSNKSWETYENLLWEDSLDGDAEEEAIEEQRQLKEKLQREWQRYIQVPIFIPLHGFCLNICSPHRCKIMGWLMTAHCCNFGITGHLN